VGTTGDPCCRAGTEPGNPGSAPLRPFSVSERESCPVLLFGPWHIIRTEASPWHTLPFFTIWASALLGEAAGFPIPPRLAPDWLPGTGQSQCFLPTVSWKEKEVALGNSLKFSPFPPRTAPMLPWPPLLPVLHSTRSPCRPRTDTPVRPLSLPYVLST
jgi:hypothetical protein